MLLPSPSTSSASCTFVTRRAPATGFSDYSSRVDYCNIVLAGLPASLLAPLQYNAAARFVADLHPIINDVPQCFSNLQPCSIEMLEKVIRMSPSKSCEFDPIPTSILKEFLDDLLPFLHFLCNSSLTSGFLPGSQKRVIVTPALKKHGLDPDVLNNYRPISNLSYLSKILEKLVSMQFVSYLNEHELLPAHQSGFRAGHSTETVLVRLLSDVFSAMDSGDVRLLALLDV